MTSVRDSSPDVVITHPNRESAAAKGTRAMVIFVQVLSGALMLLVAIAGWNVLQGAQGLWIVMTLLFFYYAYAVNHWRSGLLPLVAGTAVLAGTFAAVSVPSWFDRGGTGYDQPLLPEELLGVLTLAFAVLSLVNVVVSLRAFSQKWNVELEVPRSELRSGARVAA